jgi:hypothetical protein
MRGHSSIIIKSMAACLAVLGGAGLGGLAAGFNARTSLPPRPAASAVIADLSASEAVNLRFPAHWSDTAAEEAMPQKVALASADSRMVLLSPSPTYPVAAAAPPPPQPTVAEAQEKPKPAVQTAALAKPPAPKPVHRSNAVLNEAQIASIKRRLNLTPDQQRYWPAVEAELRKMEYAKRATSSSSQTASVDMSKVNVEGLKSAGYPLVMSFSDDQRRELRSLVHLLGLDSVMAGI